MSHAFGAGRPTRPLIWPTQPKAWVPPQQRRPPYADSQHSRHPTPKRPTRTAGAKPLERGLLGSGALRACPTESMGGMVCPAKPKAYSHSMVAGGFEEMSYTTRLIPETSLTIREEIFARSSCGKGTQSAVMPSLE